MKLLILVPTYNEKDNIEALLKALRIEVPTANILVLDDSSPDGTGEIVTKLSKTDRAIHLMSRKVKEGLGKAYVAGFRWALDHDYTNVVTMDADFSHDPKDVPSLIAAVTAPETAEEKREPRHSEAAEQRRVVIGSRYVPGGKIEGWGMDRYLLSATANLVTRTALGLKPKDSSAGFKCYPRAFLESLDLDGVIAAGYAFQVEMLMKAQDAGFLIKEVPITFVDRRAGQSKIQGEAKRSIAVILKLARRRESLKQFVKFCVIGLANVVVDWTIYFAIEYFTAIAKPVIKLISFVAAASNSYYFNRTWTFRSTNTAVRTEFVKFFLVSTVGAALNTGIFTAMITRFGVPDVVGLFVATALVTLWNFFANKYWTFKA